MLIFITGIHVWLVTSINISYINAYIYCFVVINQYPAQITLCQIYNYFYLRMMKSKPKMKCHTQKNFLVTVELLSTMLLRIIKGVYALETLSEVIYLTITVLTNGYRQYM